MLGRLLPILAGLAAIVVAAWIFWPASPPPPPPAPPAPPPAPIVPAPAAPVAAEPAPQIPRYPVEEAKKEPLPPLKASDAALTDALVKLLGSAGVQKLLGLEDIVRRIVATIDNLPRESYATRLNPVKPMGGILQVQGKDDTLAIAPANAARYTAFVELAEKIDARAAVALYRRFYPLFQQAYVELGYPNGYFNDRLIAVIDHLIATPDVAEPIRLKVPHVLYVFADPRLEERSCGQKALIRMGPENAARLKVKLRSLRAHLVPAGARSPGKS